MPTPEPPRLSIDETDNTLVLSGDVDSHTAPSLQERINRLDEHDELRLDLSDVAFIDSSGLRVVIAAHQDREARDQRLVLSAVSDSVKRLLEITSLTEHLNLS